MSLLDWSHRVSELRERRSFTQEADEGERAAITDLLGNAECLRLSASYTIAPKRDGRFEVQGRIAARLGQTCGVTLEPIEQLIDEPFEVVFSMDGPTESEFDAAFDPLGDDPPEPIVNNRLEVGRIVAEIVASAADPFPRATDAVLEVSEAGGEEEATGDSPFAALDRLAKRDGGGGE